MCTLSIFFSTALFGYSLTGLVLIDLMEFLSGFEASKFNKLKVGVASSWHLFLAHLKSRLRALAPGLRNKSVEGREALIHH